MDGENRNNFEQFAKIAKKIRMRKVSQEDIDRINEVARKAQLEENELAATLHGDLES